MIENDVLLKPVFYKRYVDDIYKMMYHWNQFSTKDMLMTYIIAVKRIVLELNYHPILKLIPKSFLAL